MPAGSALAVAVGDLNKQVLGSFKVRSGRVHISNHGNGSGSVTFNLGSRPVVLRVQKEYRRLLRCSAIFMHMEA